MIDKLTYLETETEKYPLAFTLNVMEAIQDEYKSLDEWSKLLQNTQEPNIKALKFFLVEAINEGLDIEGKEEKITSKQVGRLISRVGIEQTGEKIKNLISKSLPESNSSKNAKTTKNQKT